MYTKVSKHAAVGPLLRGGRGPLGRSRFSSLRGGGIFRFDKLCTKHLLCVHRYTCLFYDEVHSHMVHGWIEEAATCHGT